MKKMKNQKTNYRKKHLYFSIGLFLCLVVSLGVFFLKTTNQNKRLELISYTNIAKAQADNFSSGWLWGGTDDGLGNSTGVGWISMNSDDCDTDGNGFFDVNCGGDNATTAVIQYGVEIPLTDGELSGHAWSGNLGWVSFNEADLSGCPVGVCSARRNGDELEGWARIMGIAQAGINSGGWQGWISLNDSTGGGSVDYGVNINNMDGTGTTPTYAWSDELGWIDFSRARPTIEPLGVDLTASYNSSPPAGSLLIELSDGELAESITLYWDVSGTATTCIASCTSGACSEWTGEKDVLGGNQEVNLENPFTTFKIDCSNDTEADSDTLTVSVGCNNSSCSGTTCLENWQPTLSYNCNRKCESDDQCISPGRTWREVAP